MVEDFLDGEEASFFALLDGNTCLALASAQVCTVLCLTLSFCRVFVHCLQISRHVCTMDTTPTTTVIPNSTSFFVGI